MVTNERATAPARRARRIGVLVIVLASAVALAGWTAIVTLSVLNGWGRAPLATRGDIQAFTNAANHKLDTEARGNVAFALLDQGRLYSEHFVSHGQPVQRDTLFQVASLSKWITA